jgi:hypothetical protein
MNLIRKYIHLLLEGKPRILNAFCAAVLLIILIAGFWPGDFFPANKVTWLEERDGVRFYGQSMIISAYSSQKQQSSTFASKSISLELWLRPALETGNAPSILTIYDGKSPDLLAIKQWRSHLIIWSRAEDPASRKRGKPYSEVGFLKALPKDQDIFITITSGAEGTAFYLNGQLTKTYPRHRLPTGYLQNNMRLVLGNSPSGESYWSGDMLGLAIFNRALKPDEVLQNYQSWMANDPFSIRQESGLISLYPFYERKGKTINNIANPDEMLIIPEVFKPLKRIVLAFPGYDFRWNWPFAQDVIINLLGFIPFGFFFAAFLLKLMEGRRLPAYLMTCFLGIAVSLLIELSQSYLPTRDSSLVDVAMNSAGTILGVVFFSWLKTTPSK